MCANGHGQLCSYQLAFRNPGATSPRTALRQSASTQTPPPQRPDTDLGQNVRQTQWVCYQTLLPRRYRATTPAATEQPPNPRRHCVACCVCQWHIRVTNPCTVILIDDYKVQRILTPPMANSRNHRRLLDFTIIVPPPG